MQHCERLLDRYFGSWNFSFEYDIFTASIALHNYLRTEDLSAPTSGALYVPDGYADIDDHDNGNWRTEEGSLALRNINQLGSNNATAAAKEMRNSLASYFTNEGKVSWQMQRVCLQ